MSTSRNPDSAELSDKKILLNESHIGRSQRSNALDLRTQVTGIRSRLAGAMSVTRVAPKENERAIAGPLTHDAPPKDVVKIEELLKEASSWLCGMLYRLFMSTTLATVNYVLSVFKPALHWLRIPLAVTVAALGVFALIWVFSYIIGNAIAGLICKTPFSTSYISFCVPTSTTSASLHFNALIDVQRDSLETLLDESVGMSAVGWDLKRAELATGDLVRLVRMSELKRKEVLATHLENVMLNAKSVGRSLLTFDNIVQWAAESTIVANDFAIQTLDSKTGSTISSLSRGYLDQFDTVPTDLVNSTFHYALDIFSNRMGEVLVKIEGILFGLDELDRALGVLHEIVSQERITIMHERDEVLAALWTYLGGNRAKLSSLADHLTLLRSVSSYRLKALHAIHHTIDTLTTMDDGITHLRIRAGTDTGRYSLANMKMELLSIRSGVARITESRMNAQKRSLRIREAALADVDSMFLGKL